MDFESALFAQSFLEFQAIRVVYPSVVVVSVAVQRLTCIVLLWVAFVTVTVVGCTVCFPIISTNPAKLMFASIASHMRTPSVLFNAHLAFGTVLSVHEKIVSGLRIVLALDVPLTNSLAGIGRVISELALETVLSVT